MKINKNSTTETQAPKQDTREAKRAVKAKAIKLGIDVIGTVTWWCGYLGACGVGVIGWFLQNCLKKLHRPVALVKHELLL
jgi:hypothetical protein